MSRVRFVRPETTTLPLSDGDTITIRKRLNAGERRAMFARMYETDQEDAEGKPRLRVNTLQTGLALVVAYLLDWSFADESGAVVSLRGLSTDEVESIVNSLHPDSFAEIKTAIETYTDAVEAAEAEEKKVPSGELVL